MKRLLILILLFPVVVCGQFDSVRILYEVEYKPKGLSTPDTTINIDSTGVFEITASWNAVTGFDTSSVTPIYDHLPQWLPVGTAGRDTVITAPIQINSDVYSFRVWSLYIHKSGNIARSFAPSPEFVVEFILPEKRPERVYMKMRFESK